MSYAGQKTLLKKLIGLPDTWMVYYYVVNEHCDETLDLPEKRKQKYLNMIK